MGTSNFGQAADRTLTAVAASQGPSTKPQQASELDHKRHFLATFRRWEILFKRTNGDVQADKWLIAEYYDSLKHLTPQGFDVLTRELKERCTFFPTIRECLEITRPASKYEWGHPFRNRELFADQRLRIAAQPAAPMNEDHS